MVWEMKEYFGDCWQYAWMNELPQRDCEMMDLKDLKV